uniref:carboxypeptidase-like regulatory domain-containing protein n=1 Tax=Chishuiella sp. TaxID=1969467 RepID=UPI0028AD4168|nr:carboxypeptidase-like regulatory domain-containing protein [Chishuiella sp.]
MNIKSTFILLLLIQCNQLSSQNIVKGDVKDENSKPIAQAIVYVDGSRIKSNTNNQGEFTLDLPSGQYNLIVRADLLPVDFKL